MTTARERQPRREIRNASFGDAAGPAGAACGSVPVTRMGPSTGQTISFVDALRRRAAAGSRDTEDEQPVFRVDLEDERLWCGMQDLPLPPKVFALLRLFVEHPHRLLRKEHILNAIWPHTCITEGMIKEYVRDLRKAFGDDARAPRFIETVHRRGYRFIGDILVVNGPASPRPSPSLPPDVDDTRERPRGNAAPS